MRFLNAYLLWHEPAELSRAELFRFAAWLEFVRKMCYDGLQQNERTVNHLMKRQKFWVCFFLVFAVLTAALIFYFSAQKAVDSSAISDRITRRVAKVVRPHYHHLSSKTQRSYLELVSTLVRKNAHFCEFMLLGFNLMGFFRFRDFGMRERDCHIWAWGVATIYAATDELHQLFIADRAAMFTDVLIDSAGSLVGSLVMTLFLLILARLFKWRLPWRQAPLQSGH